ncbi:hypothetical protein LFAB_01135 [Lactiplantibacillus fabifermentans T30PCM01]|uniref:Uncharacterized protein n=1 Tax=Lactiplantibacillus fabifermentans T30PCM01 TaxID=1400520 RepID=W6TDG6_9LACO|nr:hypothetical protein LFAB_01135 [Lactiplantibacillus fabifermentans T30PCM01]
MKRNLFKQVVFEQYNKVKKLKLLLFKGHA